jgi:tetratricopeptide (TPR) repeat protein
MALRQIRARALVFIAVVFLALVVVQLRWNADVQRQASAEAQSPQVSRFQISKDGRLVDVNTEPLSAPTSPDDLIETSIGLLSRGSTNERRTTAVELSYMANAAAEKEKLLALSDDLRGRLRQALLNGLRDPDAAVAGACSEALIGCWGMSESPAVTQYLQSGLSALGEGQYDAALETFQSIEVLGRTCPPDLYRMKAEVYLAKSLPEQALAEARRALQAEPKHFLALYLEARAYAQMGQDRKALEALDEALSIYPAFPEAQHLRAQLYRAA